MTGTMTLRMPSRFGSRVLRRSRHAAACGIFLVAGVLSERAQGAEISGVRLDVTRGEGAATCPDGEQLTEELGRRMGPRTANAATPLVIGVNLSADGIEYVAALRVSGRKVGERTLRAVGPSCDSLREALLVALLVLLDEDREPAAPAASAEEPSFTAEPAPALPPPAEPLPAVPDPGPVTVEPTPGQRTPMSLWLAFGGGLTHGLPVDWSGALLFDLAVRVGHVEISAGGLWAPERHISTPPGEITIGTFGERLRGCYAWLPRGKEGPRVLGCADGVIANLQGNGLRLQGGRGVSRPWFLAGASAEATLPLTRRIDVGISTTVLATVHEERFSVDGVDGIPFATDAALAIFALRLEARLF